MKLKNANCVWWGRLTLLVFLDLAVLPAGWQLEEGTIYIKGLRINKVHNNIATINICMFGGGFSIFLFILIAEISCHN